MKSYRQSLTSERRKEGRPVFSRGESPHRLSNPKLSAMTDTHTNNTKRAQQTDTQTG